MKIGFLKVIILSLFLASPYGNAQEFHSYTLEELQGAWWSNKENPTASFGIFGAKVWLDSYSELQPCEIKDNILIFHLGEDNIVENEILNIEGNSLELRNILTNKFVTYSRKE